jgi:hypothetical protein
MSARGNDIEKREAPDRGVQVKPVVDAEEIDLIFVAVAVGRDG